MIASSTVIKYTAITPIPPTLAGPKTNLGDWDLNPALSSSGTAFKTKAKIKNKMVASQFIPLTLFDFCLKEQAYTKTTIIPPRNIRIRE